MFYKNGVKWNEYIRQTIFETLFIVLVGIPYCMVLNNSKITTIFPTFFWLVVNFIYWPVYAGLQTYMILTQQLSKQVFEI